MKEKVPFCITGKDLDYFSDMFHWNYGAYKSTCSNMSCVEDEEIKKIQTKACEIFKCNMDKVLCTLEGGSDE